MTNRTFSLPLTKLIREKLFIVIAYALSRVPMEAFLETLEGEWKYLRKALLNDPQHVVEQACLELALFLRMLDDIEPLPKNLSCGQLIKNSGASDLSVRDVANKIIHASALRWDFSIPDNPRLVCESNEPDRWLRAEIGVLLLARYCGLLMS